MRFTFIASIIFISLALPGKLLSDDFTPRNTVENMDISNFRLPSKSIYYNFGFAGSSDGYMYSWAGATKRFMPSSNLLVDVDVSYVRHFGENRGNYLVSAGRMTYFMSDKLTLNISVIAPAIKLGESTGVPGSW